MTAHRSPAPDDGVFDVGFAAELDRLFRWRRDVRRFRTDPLADGLLEEIIASAELSPSVGNSQPWRWVQVVSPERRAAIREAFGDANAEALEGYRGDRARVYAGLKLSGLDDAPVHLAVFAHPDPGQGDGLGRRTMPETVEYSVVMAVASLWFAARARGIGVGWVSIIDPARVHAALDVPDDWRLVAYLCLGYPAAASEVPELETVGWQARTDAARRRLTR
ncbi:MAG: 5,6-dimethylbenzimidazole synthase [Gordonia sp. (in: high G+C Gram-positive bacteria)]|uniref:5,6-dimethylbenzimidazole synthase n=1 Tax=Gordonia sp. (in: high G+C Gram-positive bacteria) TaxID=84139 RepID=UPI0039E45F06